MLGLTLLLVLMFFQPCSALRSPRLGKGELVYIPPIKLGRISVIPSYILSILIINFICKSLIFHKTKLNRHKICTKIEILKNKLLLCLSISTLCFPYFYYMLGVKLGLHLHGDISVMLCICLFILHALISVVFVSSSWCQGLAVVCEFGTP